MYHAVDLDYHTKKYQSDEYFSVLSSQKSVIAGISSLLTVGRGMQSSLHRFFRMDIRYHFKSLFFTILLFVNCLCKLPASAKIRPRVINKRTVPQWPNKTISFFLSLKEDQDQAMANGSVMFEVV